MIFDAQEEMMISMLNSDMETEEVVSRRLRGHRIVSLQIIHCPDWYGTLFANTRATYYQAKRFFVFYSATHCVSVNRLIVNVESIVE